MKDEKFIEEIIQLYFDARECKFQKGNQRIKRGRSHSISSLVEDLFASYISTIIDNDFEIFIDQPISYKISDKSKTIYPDILIAKEGEIFQLWDLKMDLGWKRDTFNEFCESKEHLIEALKNKKITLKDSFIKKEYNLNSSLTYNIVVVSLKNISAKQSKHIQEKLEEVKNVKTYFLTDGFYLNSYGISKEEIFKKITIKKDQFDLLKDRIKDNSYRNEKPIN